MLNNVGFYVSDNIDYTCKPEFWPDNVVFSSEYQINRTMSKKDAKIAVQKAYQMRGYNIEGTKIKKEGCGSNDSSSEIEERQTSIFSKLKRKLGNKDEEGSSSSVEGRKRKKPFLGLTKRTWKGSGESDKKGKQKKSLFTMVKAKFKTMKELASSNKGALNEERTNIQNHDVSSSSIVLEQDQTQDLWYEESQIPKGMTANTEFSIRFQKRCCAR